MSSRGHEAAGALAPRLPCCTRRRVLCCGAVAVLVGATGPRLLDLTGQAGQVVLVQGAPSRQAESAPDEPPTPNASAAAASAPRSDGPSRRGGLSEEENRTVLKFEEAFRTFDSVCCDERLEPSAVKLLIIVTDVAREWAYRDVHRRTWMSRLGLCPLNESSSSAEPPGCGAFGAFAVGRDGHTNAEVVQEARRFGDMLILDVQDPYREDGVVSAGVSGARSQLKVKAKTQHALRYASKLFPWLTHIAKNDLDNFPWVHAIVLDLLNPRRVGNTSRTRKPARWSEAGNGLYYGLGMGDPDTMVSGMQGQFYALSQSLLTCIFRQEWGEEMCRGRPGEDSQMGCQVRVASRAFKNKPNKCPEPMQIDTGFRHKRWIGCKPEDAAAGRLRPDQAGMSKMMFSCQLSKQEMLYWNETIHRVV